MSTYMDGNMLGGPLSEIFAIDITPGIAKCAACGTSSAIAELHVYGDSPGLVARCPRCGDVMLTLVRSPDRAWLSMRGIVSLEMVVPNGQAENGTEGY